MNVGNTIRFTEMKAEGQEESNEWNASPECSSSPAALAGRMA